MKTRARNIFSFHLNTWKESSLHGVVQLHTVALLLYGLALWVSPEQFEHLHAYGLLHNLMPVELWATLTTLMGFGLLMWPLHSRCSQAFTLLGAAFVWAFNAIAITVALKYVATPSMIYGTLSLFALLAFGRHESEEGAAL